MINKTSEENLVERKFEVYKLAFEHNDKEWEMLWQKNGHYMVANSALFFTISFLSSTPMFAFILSLLGLLLSILWLFTNKEAYGWNQYWIRRLQELECELPFCKLWGEAVKSAAKLKGRPSTRFYNHGTYLAFVFVICWTLLALFFFLSSIGITIMPTLIQ